MNKEKVLKFIKDIVPYIAIVLIVILIRTFFFTPIRVVGPSMNPTLKNGDIMILNKIAKIDRYDIVVIKSKKASDIIIKRVIGLPGETVEIKEGNIYINGKKIKDKYGFEKKNDYYYVELPKDEYFVLGDNRPISADSRLFGTFKKKEIKGTTKLTIFPFKNIGFKK